MQNNNAHSSSCQLLATPIIPILTPDPRALSAFLLAYVPSAPSAVIPDTSSPAPAPSAEPCTATASTPPETVLLRTKPIYPPSVPKGTSRVRICLHAGHTREDVALLAEGIAAWADMRMTEDRRHRQQWRALARDVGVGTWMEAKL